MTRVLAAFSALLLALACASDDVRVSTTVDPLAIFPEQASYVWDEAANRPLQERRLEPLDLDALFREAADEAFAARGYRRSEAPPADYRLSYQTQLTEILQADHSRAVATIYLFLAEPSTGRRVWAGGGEAELHVGLERSERKQRIRKALDAMLKGFPPSQRGD